jgi:hypothetical protein
MRLIKGTHFPVDGIYYVLVYAVADDTGVSLFCICDHANNIFSWSMDNVDKKIPVDHETPYEVICEVLRGEHDHRFDHWSVT